MADPMRSIKDIEPYSVFGYLMPGTALTAGLAAHWEHSSNWIIDNILKSNTATTAIIYISVFLLIAYALGHALSAISSLALDSLLADKVIGYPIDGLLNPDRKIRFFEAVKYYISFTPNYRSRLEQIFLQRYQFTPSRSELYWTAFSAVAAKGGVGVNRILSFVGLYGFSRNLSMAALILAFLPSYYYRLYGHSWLSWTTIFIILFIALALNYMKLLKRCDTEICTHFLVLYDSNDSSSSLSPTDA